MTWRILSTQPPTPGLGHSLSGSKSVLLHKVHRLIKQKLFAVKDQTNTQLASIAANSFSSSGSGNRNVHIVTQTAVSAES